MALTAVFLVALAIIAGILFYPAWRDRRALGGEFPPHWRAIIARRLPIWHRLTADERRQLEDLVRLFLARKHYYGCDGQQIDDDVRLTIAVQACLLLLNRRTGVYPRLRSILVYPYAFWTAHPRHNEDGTVSLDGSGLQGESWETGKVILSWDDVVHGASDYGDGYNVVIHEFAHQLDAESGAVNGTPSLAGGDYEAWTRVMRREYQALREDVAQGRATVMDPYGATNPAEFFAVASETFFEYPQDLAYYHAELYTQLQGVYRVDPRRWHG